MAVVARRLVARLLLLPHLLQALRRAEAAVGVPARDQPLGVLAVERGPLALGVGPVRTALVRSFVPVEAEPREDVDDPFGRALDKPVAVGVLDAEQERARLAFARCLPVGEEPVEERGPRRRRRGASRSGSARSGHARRRWTWLRKSGLKPAKEPSERVASETNWQIRVASINLFPHPTAQLLRKITY